MSRLIPGSTLGILGGGQLGQMMALSAIAMGYRIAILDPDANCPAHALANTFICARYDDEQALQQLCSISDVVTYEFENVDADLVERHKDKFPQGAKALRISQHRLEEKRFAQSLGLEVPAYHFIQSKEDLDQLTQFPVLIKTCRFGYDGKGQIRVDSKDDLKSLDLSFPGEYLAERLLDLQGECAVVLTVFKDGIAAFEPFETLHRDGILSSSIYPASMSEALKAQAIQWATRLASNLDTLGTMAVEFFIVDGRLVFNEMAPRPHNSAHGTIEGSSFSQYEQHVAAIMGASFTPTRCVEPNVLLNILGQDMDQALSLVEMVPAMHLHLYGKTDVKPKRKMGHLVFGHNDPKILSDIADQWRHR